MIGGKNLEIQSLRAYAVLLVLIAHMTYLVLPLNPKLQFFWLGCGVDLFFCISGFVIARSLFERKEAGFLQFYLPFLIRRAYRLWPASLFWTFVTVVLVLGFNKHKSFGGTTDTMLTAIASLFQLVNVRLVSCLYTGYAECSISSPLRIYWSLSLEEQFYFVFPVVLFFMGNRKAALLAAIVAVSQVFLFRPYPSPLWFFRTDALCIGILIAYLHTKEYASIVAPVFLDSIKVRKISSVILCLLLVLVAKKEVVWFFNGMVAIVSGLLVFVASYDKSYFMKDGRFRNFMAYIGERSYSIYLTHMICMLFIKEVYVRSYQALPTSGGTPFFLGICSILLTLAASEVSYRYIETPLRKKGRLVADNFLKSRFQGQ